MKPKPKVVIELLQRGAELKGRVVRMDEKLRGTETLAEAVDWTLYSEVCPELMGEDKILCIGGRNKKRDKDTFRFRFENVTAASLAVVAIRALLDKVNGIKPPKASKWVKVI